MSLLLIGKEQIRHPHAIRLRECEIFQATCKDLFVYNQNNNYPAITYPVYHRIWGAHPSIVLGRLTVHCTPVGRRCWWWFIMRENFVNTGKFNVRLLFHYNFNSMQFNKNYNANLVVFEFLGNFQSFRFSKFVFFLI